MVISFMLCLSVVYCIPRPDNDAGQFQGSWKHLTDVPRNFTDDTAMVDLSYNFMELIGFVQV